MSPDPPKNGGVCTPPPPPPPPHTVRVIQPDIHAEVGCSPLLFVNFCNAVPISLLIAITPRVYMNLPINTNLFGCSLHIQIAISGLPEH